MTTIIGITTPDGIVLGSDSRITLTSDSRDRVLSDSAQKVFAIGRFGVVFSGLSQFGGETIAGLMDQFLSGLTDADNRNLDSFADALGKFFAARFIDWYDDDNDTWNTEVDADPLSFLAAGYNDDGVGELLEVGIPSRDVDEFRPSTVAQGSMWRGQTDVISRLLKGIDLRALLGTGFEMSDGFMEQVDKLEYVTLDPVTIQDAVDYCTFLLQATIDMQRFSDGTAGDPGLVPGCGGPLQLLSIERKGPIWIKSLSVSD
ncbi:MAG: hypothetical protein HYX29_08595 [Solirubrobacterales bacterium]|nr:hypothetical protein [Solirubrobacterales bacterium]